MAKYRKREDAYYYSEKEQEKGSAINTALLVGGLLAGGYLFWRTGLLKASIQKTMVLGSKYKPGPVARAIEGVYKWERKVVRGNEKLSPIAKASALKDYVIEAVRDKGYIKKPQFYLEQILEESQRVLGDLKTSWNAQRDAAEAVIEQGADVIKAKVVAQIEKQLAASNKLQNLMQKAAGVRYAVLDDIMNLKNPEFYKLKRLAKIYGLDGKNIIVDPALFINEAGELIDMRGLSEQLKTFIRRLEKDIQIPIVNFNPLGLVHLSDILGANRKPFVYLFEETEIQPLLTGNIEQLGRQLLFIGGEVFDVQDIPQKIDDLVKVNKGMGYLLPGLGNVKLQYIRTMAGLEMNEYTPRHGVRGILDPLFKALDIGYQDTFLWDDPRLKVLSGAADKFGLLGRKEAENPLFEAMESGIRKIMEILGPERSSEIPIATQRFLEQRWVYVNATDISSLGSVWKQLTAGRHRLQDVSTLTLIPYIGMARMDLALGKAGLGLSSEHTGNALSIFTNMFLRRALVLGGLAFGWHYLNYEMEKLTGVRPEFLLADAYRYTMTALSRLSSAIGLTGFMDRLQQLTPGSDQILELPIVKDATIWMTKTPEEMEEWFESGEEPVRKGRYWPLGNTPFTGGRIQVWRPNWYRRLKSKWKYTDVLYGSEDEYFAHAPIPTPRYPTAPIKRYVTDRYWLEEKHYYERPYLYTGDYPELVELPIIGPLLTAVSRLIKPRKKMHPEVWAQLEGRPEGELPEGEYLVVEPPAGGGAAAGPSGGYGAVGGLEGAAGQPEGTAERHETAGEPEEETTEGGYITSGGVRVEITPEGDIVDEYGRKYTAPGSARDVARAFWSSVTEVAGFYGFLAETATGISQDVPKDKEVRIAEARGIYSIRRRFWEENLGGLGGNVNEIVRRFIGRREKWGEMFNPVPNRMPSWLPKDYYIDFHHGDPYAGKIPYGEMLLPGGGYEALYNKDFAKFLKEHPEIAELHKKGVINRFELYGPLDRFRILAHVAPYSKEYKEYSKLMSKIKLTPEQKEEVKRIREMVRKMKEPLRIYPYRFVGAERELKKRVVTVESLADNNTIFVKELPNIPIKFAGIHVAGAKDDKAAQRAAELLQSKLKPGTKVVIYYEPDDERKARKDYSPIKAVVYVKDENINRMLLKEKVAKEKEKDYSPAAVLARFSPLERTIGKAWERLAHLDTPIHTKFLQVRSAYEDWVRREVYGKNFQSWEHPIRDFLIPTYQSFISKPLPIAMLLGAGIGALFGRRPATRVIGAAIGAATVGAGALYTTTYQVVTGKKWVPARRRREWELEQYMDILKYVKYKRLYEYERKRALEEEGFDVQKYFEARDKHKELVKARKRALMEAKRAIQKLKEDQTDELFRILEKYNIRLAVEDDKKRARKAVKRPEQKAAAQEVERANALAQAETGEANEQEKAKRVQRSFDELKKLAIKSINAELASLKTSSEVSEEDLPVRARRAIAYYRQMKQTMYGYEPGEPLGDFIVALPKKERRYFRYFLKMPKWEYKQLKKVAPEWLFYGLAPAHGDRAPKKPKLEEYFKTHYLPDESWEGWRPDVDLEAVRVKLVDKMHLDPGEFDIWEEDELRAQQVPVRAPKMNMRTPGNAGEIAERLRRLLSAAGVEDIDVNVEPSDKAGIEVNMHMGYDMSRDLVEYINRDPAMLLAD